ncbi:elongation factor G [Kaistia dalseonensis]|uniref:Elongation factor G n=1 Tax=Kaistia dalseonensis TaxID=410840 RepID=A0ABU0H871_9HYPH|nr:elongation factor G [Kaistia dalseonensis]MCX5495117.1 elongation factor G [Kaistia dalseonensis]MDQ0437699.1 elongation factor G [Kaistia dalseonensis]
MAIRDGGEAGAQAGPRKTGPKTVALIGPLGSGKTTLMEAMLARTGAIARQGSVDDGTSVGDGAPEARSHHMSVELNVAETGFMGERIALLDCPGSVEFQHEGDAALAIADCAIVVAEADEKKVPALQVILRHLEDHGIPRILFLNKIDKTAKGVQETLAFLQPASRVPLLLRHIPIRQHDIVTGFVDLALERAFLYREQAPSEIVDLSGPERVREAEARYAMLERLADYDDALMEELLEDVQPSRERVFSDLVADMRAGLLCPVMIGSALHGHGVGRLLKAIRHEAPDVADTAERLGLPSGADAVAQVIKTVHTGHAGKLSIARVLRGNLSDGAELNGPDGAVGRVSGLLRVIGQQMAKREPAMAGEIVGLGKVDGARTGMTLGTGKAAPPQLAPLALPEPVITLAISPIERRDDAKLSTALAKLGDETPTLQVSQDEEVGEIRIGGQGEMHLRVALERLAGRYGLAVETKPPAIPYRETIRGETSVRGRHKKQSGGHGQFGDCVLEIRPTERGAGFLFQDAITGGVVPRNYIPAIEDGIRDVLRKGALGFPVVDVAVRLVDGSYHSVDSSDQAFRTAAQVGMREGLERCRPVMLEPMLRVTATVPSEASPRVNMMVTQRRGQLLGFDARPGWPGWDIVEAIIPEAEMSGLIVELRSATAGVGSYESHFDHLAEVTGRLAEQIAERSGVRAA